MRRSEAAEAVSPYVLTALAKADIFEIWTYIAEDNDTVADRIEQESETTPETATMIACLMHESCP